MSKFLVLVLSCASILVSAADKVTVKSPSIEVTKAWVRLLPGKMSTGAFMEIKNLTDKDLYLVKAQSPIAKTVELHDHIKVDGVMKMQAIEKIKITAKSSVLLKPGSLHVMLIDLTSELKKDSTADIELQVSDGSTLTIKAPILAQP